VAVLWACCALATAAEHRKQAVSYTHLDVYKRQRVMLTAWDFEWMDRNQQQRTTRTAQVLLDEVSYPIMMHQVIGDRSRRNDPLVNLSLIHI